MQACGTYKIPITVMNKTVNHDIVIVANLNSNAIVGIDLIEHLCLVYKSKKKKFVFEEEEPQFCEATMETLSAKVIPAFTQMTPSFKNNTQFRMCIANTLKNRFKNGSSLVLSNLQHRDTTALLFGFQKRMEG